MERRGYGAALGVAAVALFAAEAWAWSSSTAWRWDASGRAGQYATAQAASLANAAPILPNARVASVGARASDALEARLAGLVSRSGLVLEKPGFTLFLR